MKHLLLCLLLLSGFLSLSVFVQNAEAQSLPEPRQSPLGLSRVMLDDDSYVKIVYGRPQMRDREIFGQLVPYGEVWRTGANEATEITLTQAVMIDGERLEAGTYSLFTIPGEDAWTIIINEKLGSWGAYSYDESADVMRLSAPADRTDEAVEAFTIMFEQEEDEARARLMMRWEHTQVSVMLEPAG